MRRPPRLNAKRSSACERKVAQPVIDSNYKETPQWHLIEKRHWNYIKQFGRVKLGGELKSVLLRETGFWNLLQHFIGNEGFQFVHDALGYESIVGNWNAAECSPGSLPNSRAPRNIS